MHADRTAVSARSGLAAGPDSEGSVAAGNGLTPAAEQSRRRDGLDPDASWFRGAGIREMHGISVAVEGQHAFE
ncbi:hypothetical protein THIARS_70286 [Thiomonas delicata]|jgi:hypothetical protein|uniref:Uncharacterized protein n=1 Tax=Thiomonas delicata TaxID=364030 RepID=A0A238D5U2_THIDL|nr:hypothetical protein THIARS_70286 [Thiomonas delicata]